MKNKGYRLVHSFAPIIDENAEILVLGSLPSVISVLKKQYYANPRNMFWTIIYRAFGKAEVDQAYEDRIQFLLSRGIALWDVLHSAERYGASDAKIKNEKPNDIPLLLRQYPRVQRIVIAGVKAAKAFRAARFSDITIEVVCVPSTSPIPGRYTKTLDEKIEIWKSAVC